MDIGMDHTRVLVENRSPERAPSTERYSRALRRAKKGYIIKEPSERERRSLSDSMNGCKTKANSRGPR